MAHARDRVLVLAEVVLLMTRLQALWFALTGRTPKPVPKDYGWCMVTARCILDEGHEGRCRE